MMRRLSYFCGINTAAAIAKTTAAGTIEIQIRQHMHSWGSTMQRVKSTIIAPTPFGSVALVWTVMAARPVLVRVLIPQPGLPVEEQLQRNYPGYTVSSCTEMEALASGIKALLEGEDVDFSLDLADMSQCSNFQQSVLQADHRIPRGSVSTYQLIAAHLGKPGGTRAVGNALAANPYPLIIPCHRVIRSDGHLGGYLGGLAMKRALLEREGIVVHGEGYLVSPRLHYDVNLSE